MIRSFEVDEAIFGLKETKNRVEYYSTKCKEIILSKFDYERLELAQKVILELQRENSILRTTIRELTANER